MGQLLISEHRLFWLFLLLMMMSESVNQAKRMKAARVRK